MQFSLDQFIEARKNLENVINPTPLQYSRTFSEMAGCSVYLKPECLQKNGSFKIRGAFNALSSLSREQKEKGIITSSSGNWAQSVAYCCQQLGLKALIVMPEFVSRPKLEATKGYGAEVLVYGSSSLELFEKVRQLSAETKMTWIHAFDEPAVPSLHSTLLGYGSISLEILAEQPDTEVAVVPVGGGALISGIAVASKLANPKIRIIGVQPEGATAMYESLRAGKIVVLDKTHSIAEALGVRRPSEKTFQLVRRYVDKIVLVTDDEIKSAQLLLLERAKLLVEPSGSVPLAAVLNRKIGQLTAHSKVAIVLSGGNIDLALLKQLLP